jgi:hypothetical protein
MVRHIKEIDIYFPDKRAEVLFATAEGMRSLRREPDAAWQDHLLELGRDAADLEDSWFLSARYLRGWSMLIP